LVRCQGQVRPRHIGLQLHAKIDSRDFSNSNGRPIVQAEFDGGRPVLICRCCLRRRRRCSKEQARDGGSAHPAPKWRGASVAGGPYTVKTFVERATTLSRPVRRLCVVCVLALVAACSGQPTGPEPINTSTQVWVGAGDIGRCGSLGPEATAALVDRLPGTVFTAGDNAYPSGRFEDYVNCYDPSWGRHFSRTYPVPGNHEYETP